MEFIYGINFHSANGYKYLISGDYRPSELNVDSNIAELLSAQKYSYLLQPGQKFYFVYPAKTQKGNKQVFGSGIIVRSKQPGRETILVPFVQYFAISLSKAPVYSIDFDNFFQQFGTNYDEIFNRNQTDSNLNLQSLNIKTNESIDETNLSKYSELEECFGSRGNKIRKYVTTIEEGLAVLNNLMNSPNVIRWSLSAILTPLDEEYPENIVIVYGQPPKPYLNPESSQNVFQLHSGNQLDILNRFLEYMVSRRLSLSDQTDLTIIDKIDLIELEGFLRCFVKEYSNEIPQKNIRLENKRLEITRLIEEVASKPKPTTLDLRDIDIKIAEYEKDFIQSRPFLSKQSLVSLEIPINEISKCLTNFSGDILRKIINHNSHIEISTYKLKTAILERLQTLSKNVGDFWNTDKPATEINADDVQNVNNVGLEYFTSKGVEKTTQLIRQANNFEKAAKEVEAFCTKISGVVKSRYSDGICAREMLPRCLQYLAEIINFLQESLPRFNDLSERYDEIELRFILAIQDYVFAYIDYDKRNDLNLPEVEYNKVINNLETLLETAEKKRKYLMEERHKQEQELLKVQKKQIDKYFSDFKDDFKRKRGSGRLKFLS